MSPPARRSSASAARPATARTRRLHRAVAGHALGIRRDRRARLPDHSPGRPRQRDAAVDGAGRRAAGDCGVPEDARGARGWSGGRRRPRRFTTGAGGHDRPARRPPNHRHAPRRRRILHTDRRHTGPPPGIREERPPGNRPRDRAGAAGPRSASGGDGTRHPRRARRSLALADVFRRLLGSPSQPARADHAGQRPSPRRAVDVSVRAR